MLQFALELDPAIVVLDFEVFLVDDGMDLLRLRLFQDAHHLEQWQLILHTHPVKAILQAHRSILPVPEMLQN